MQAVHGKPALEQQTAHDLACLYASLSLQYRAISSACGGQVSDLDGTMVGEGEEADAATAAFTHYWENIAALGNGVLVYNTGRSLGQFQELLESKAEVLAVPHALITAVGTKVGTAFWV